MSRGSTLTTTSFAILGLLAVQPWSTYELTRQMDRSLGRIWPRAQSKLYEEPKKLVDLGMAEASTELVGRRPRTIYAITAEGRRALTEWLREPGAGPIIEFEQLLKLFFAENGTRTDALATVAAARQWAHDRNEGNLVAARDYQAGSGPFQHRAAQNLLVGAFLVEFYRMVAQWSEWAAEQVEEWPDDPTEAVADPVVFAEVERRARW